MSGDKTLYWFGDNNYTEWADHFIEYRQPPFIPASASVALSFGIGARTPAGGLTLIHFTFSAQLKQLKREGGTSARAPPRVLF